MTSTQQGFGFGFGQATGALRRPLMTHSSTGPVAGSALLSQQIVTMGTPEAYLMNGSVVAEVVLLILSFLQVWREIRQMRDSWSEYFSNIMNMAELLSLVLISSWFVLRMLWCGVGAR